MAGVVLQEGSNNGSDMEIESHSSGSSRSTSSNVLNTFTVARAPLIPIGDNNNMPMLGLATWKATPNEVCEAVKYAISIGYRYIDCAFAYQNETEVGEAIFVKTADNTVKREELFVASKLWNTFHRREQVEVCCRKSLEYLGLDYLDLYVIHWPIAFVAQGEEYFPRKLNGDMMTEDLDFIETWRGMEDLCEKKLVKSIGLANFNISQIRRILAICTIKPAVLQIECHPYFHQNELVTFCNKNEITVTAYTPLGAPDRPWNKTTEPNVLRDYRIELMCHIYKKTPSQIALKFNIQRGITVIPASVKYTDIQDFFQIFDFKLSAEDMNKLFSCQQVRYNKNERSKNDPNYPF